MSNDGRIRKYETTPEKLECFIEFEAFDALPEPIKVNKYEDFIKSVGAGRACQALHEYQLWIKAGKPLPLQPPPPKTI